MKDESFKRFCINFIFRDMHILQFFFNLFNVLSKLKVFFFGTFNIFLESVSCSYAEQYVRDFVALVFIGVWTFIVMLNNIPSLIITEL